MKKRKLLSAALAAMLAFGTVSTVSLAEAPQQSSTEQTWTDENGVAWKEPFEIREGESKYNITLEDAVVDGKDMAAVRFSGITSKVMDAAYSLEEKRINDWDTSGDYSIRTSDLDIMVSIDIGDQMLCFETAGEDEKFIGALGTFTLPAPPPDNPYISKSDYIDESGVYRYRGSYLANIRARFGALPSLFEGGINSSSVDIKLDDKDETFDIIAFFNKDADIIKSLEEMNETTVLTYGAWSQNGAFYFADGTLKPMGGAADAFYFEISSAGKTTALAEYYSVFDTALNGFSVDEYSGSYTAYFEDDNLHKEKVKITNNLNTPETSEPTSSDTSATEPAEFKPVLTDEDESLDEDSKNVLSGITVTDSLGAFDADVVMNVKGISQTERSFSFDITFTKDGEEVQPRGKVTVKVPVPKFLRNRKIVVRHYDDDGNAAVVSSKVENDFVIFDADHFSTYELTYTKSSSSASPAANKTSESETSAPATSETSQTNPNTGITLEIAPVVLAASAAVFVFKKKK